jgi:hypothetical protein
VGENGAPGVPGSHLILGRRHLERTLREFVEHYNAERPHRGLRLACPYPTEVIEHGRFGPKARPAGWADSRVLQECSVTSFLHPSVKRSAFDSSDC